MSTLIDEIRTAKESVRRLETEASEAGYNLRLAKDRLKEGRKLLDELLEELISGTSSRYPLFPSEPEPAGNGLVEPVPPTPTAEASTAPLRGRRKPKGAVP